MSLRGMLVVPLAVLLVGLALDRVTLPTHLVTESRLYRDDWLGLRSAVQYAQEHVLCCLGGPVRQLKRLRDTALSALAGLLWADGQQRDRRGGDVKGRAGDVKGRGGDVKARGGDVKGHAGDVKGRAGDVKARGGDVKGRSDDGKGGSDDAKGRGGDVKARAGDGKGDTGHGTATRLFTAEELAEHDGSAPDKALLLALLGHVFDVSAGRQHYGPGGGYAFFAGRDASRAFVSGDFTPAGLTDDVSGLAPRDRLGLDDWLRFYGKDYTAVGRLVGRFFDENGDETPQWHAWLGELAEARRLQRQDDDEKLGFPPCNSEWSEARGGRVYCSERSGGVHRSWVGVPRQLFSGGRKRCACVREQGAPSHGADTGADRGDLDHPQLAQYDGCDEHSVSCQLKP